MAKITFVLGGARSGKSAFALEIAKKHKKVAYLATGVACDKEMKERIRRHREARPAGWNTFEEPLHLDKIAGNKLNDFDAAVLDCAGSWITNLMLKGKPKEEAVIEKVKRFLENVKSHKELAMIIVSNEVGLGLVPETKLGREFRDILGRVNQLIAKEAGEAYLLVSGMAMKIK